MWYNNATSAILIGAGKLGQAMMDYNGFEVFGLDILVGFDIDESLTRTQEGKPIFPMRELADFCRARNVTMGIITVPADAAEGTSVISASSYPN